MSLVTKIDGTKTQT